MKRSIADRRINYQESRARRGKRGKERREREGERKEKGRKVSARGRKRRFARDVERLFDGHLLLVAHEPVLLFGFHRSPSPSFPCLPLSALFAPLPCLLLCFTSSRLLFQLCSFLCLHSFPRTRHRGLENSPPLLRFFLSFFLLDSRVEFEFCPH